MEIRISCWPFSACMLLGYARIVTFFGMAVNASESENCNDNGLEECPLTASVRFKCSPCRTVREEFPRTAREKPGRYDASTNPTLFAVHSVNHSLLFPRAIVRVL